jgi:hypothetical protein
MELAAPSTSMYSALCAMFDIPFFLSGISASSASKKVDLGVWVVSPDSVRALMHALTVVRLVRHLPFADSHAPHIPIAVFASAIVLSTICLFGTTTLEVPTAPRWEAVWAQFPDGPGTDPGIAPADDQNASNFLNALNISSSGKTVSVHLPSEINFLQLALRTVTSRWGISQQMETVVQHLTAIIQERQ